MQRSSSLMIFERRLCWAVGLTLALVVGACQPSQPRKLASTPNVVAEPRWRQLRTDEDSATFVTTAVQTVGPYKRFWFAEVAAKPRQVTIQGQSGRAATRMDLLEVDCAELRIRSLQTSFMDEGDWSGTETRDKPKWTFAGPDSPSLVTIRHACAGEPLTGTGYPSLKAARKAYRSSLVAARHCVSLNLPASL